MLRLNCFFKAKEGQFEKALEAAKTLTELSRKHTGNKFYDVLVSATSKTEFIIVETWESNEALDAHSKTPEFAKYVGIIKECGELTLEQFKFE